RTKCFNVGFHIRDKLDKLPDHRTPQQLYTFFILESPPHTWDLGRDVPPDFFNISMTYRADSDVHYPYDVFEEYTKEDLERGLVSLDQIWTENEVDEKIKAKNKLALQFVSNCNTKSFREKYVEKLKNLTEITQIGTCIGGKRTCDKQCEDKLFVCLNYVTEKFWKLKKLIVPVVLSRKIFKGLNIPDDSFIAADDFKSPKELIEFLKSVAADKKRYKSYFRWTKKYKKVEYENDISNPLCNLCKLAHLNTKELRIPDIKKFWDDGGSCQYGFAENVLLG
uniref:Fucosyltransferase n=1 Tax=Meloidogyne hapla TaxID=6305 RepID=A0A1I8BQV0_MELHA